MQMFIYRKVLKKSILLTCSVGNHQIAISYLMMQKIKKLKKNTFFSFFGGGVSLQDQAQAIFNTITHCLCDLK